MLEANHPGRDFAGKQSLGRPGRLERRLLPDPQGHQRQRHVSHDLVMPPGPNPMNGVQACIYKLVNTSVFQSQL